jgi:hypothetical protein
LQNTVIALVENEVAIKRKCGAKKVAEAQAKAIEKPKQETVVVISSDEEEEVDPVSERKPRERPSPREVKTLTAILTARSKVLVVFF